jgi:hypothetical protein
MQKNVGEKIHKHTVATLVTMMDRRGNALEGGKQGCEQRCGVN